MKIGHNRRSQQTTLLHLLLFLYSGYLQRNAAPPCPFLGLSLLVGCHNQLQTDFATPNFFTMFVPYYHTLLLHFSSRERAGRLVDIIGTSGF